jgi:uracil phosphoribosyltransferase
VEGTGYEEFNCQHDTGVPVNYTVVTHPLAAQALTQLRSRTTRPAEFRAMTKQLAYVLLLDATKDLPCRAVPIDTPLDKTTGQVLAKELVVVAVLRAGLGMLEAAIELLPDVSVGFAGMQRDENTAQPSEYYMKLPPLAGRRVLVLEPMLATGGTLSRTITAIKDRGGSEILVLCVVAAKPGLERLHRDHPDVHAICAAVDRELNASYYICPGLGDMGDRLYGTLPPE